MDDVNRLMGGDNAITTKEILDRYRSDTKGPVESAIDWLRPSSARARMLARVDELERDPAGYYKRAAGNFLRLAPLTIGTEGGMLGAGTVRAGGPRGEAYMPEPYQLPGVPQSKNPLNYLSENSLGKGPTSVAGPWMSERYGQMDLPGWLPPPARHPLDEVREHSILMETPYGDRFDPPVPGRRMFHDMPAFWSQPGTNSRTMPTWPTLRHMYEHPTGVGGAVGTTLSWYESLLPQLMDAGLILATRGRATPMGLRDLGRGTSVVETLGRQPK